MMPKPRRQLALDGFEPQDEQKQLSEPAGNKTHSAEKISEKKPEKDSPLLKGRTVGRRFALFNLPGLPCDRRNDQSTR